MITPEETPNTFYRVSVKALILNEEKNLLMWLDDSWLRWFPWWWIDYWEDHATCLRREIQEEMWLEVTSINNNPLYAIYDRMNNWYPYIQIFYEVKVKNYDFTPSNECGKIDFYNKESIKTVAPFSTDVKLFQQFDPNNH